MWVSHAEILGRGFIYYSWGIYDDWPRYVGLLLTLFVLHSIKNGFSALDRGAYSDFVGYGIMLLLI